MMYASKAAVLALFLMVSLCPPAKAQDEIKPEKRALIKELYLATRADKLAESFTNVILTQMERDLPKMLSESPEIKDVSSKDRQAQAAIVESSARVLRRFKELMPQRINFAEVMEQMFYPIYDKYFTEPELKNVGAADARIGNFADTRRWQCVDRWTNHFQLRGEPDYPVKANSVLELALAPKAAQPTPVVPGGCPRAAQLHAQADLGASQAHARRACELRQRLRAVDCHDMPARSTRLAGPMRRARRTPASRCPASAAPWATWCGR